MDGDFSKMERHLETTGLPKDLKTCTEVLRTAFTRQLAGVGIDLAAGNLWAAPFLCSLPHVSKLYCLEYSKHRLLKIGPVVLDHYRVPKEKVVLVLGSFYNLQMDDQSVDFIFMSQAFHHAHDPKRLLGEICRVLKPQGAVIIIGEHIVNYPKAQTRHAVKFLISALLPERLQRRVFGKIFTVKKLFETNPNELYPPDPILGDHYYADAEYRSMFSNYGFQMKHVKNHNSMFQSFILVRG